MGLMFLHSIILSSCSDSGDVMMPDDDPGDNQNNMMNDPKAEAAPDFALESLDGSTVQLSDFENKVVVLFFLGDQCPLCRAIGPSVEKELNVNYLNRDDYVILGLDVWDGNSNSVRSFKDATGISFPLLLKASGTGSDYNTTYDRLVVINKNGGIVHKGTRAVANDLNTVKSKIDELLGSM
jgi:peroxiredoxin